MARRSVRAEVSEAQILLPLEEVPTESASREFVKVEKNLSTLGFFTPSKSRGKTVLVEKTITFRREEQGRQIEVTATILPSAKYGLPSTADQDKYFAFQKIVSDLRDRWGRVQNPVGFTSTEMLQILGMRDSGTNYQDIQEWLKRMTLTGISSKGVVYLSKRRTWVSDTFHVFDRVVEFGADLGNGDIADRNYVWLSDWQLENINNNYVMPVDLDRYWKLKGTIAKAMVPLLQLWLYASRSRGLFEKRYSDLTTILDIRRHQHLSLIRKQLAPSLDELVSQGYLESWDIEETKDHQDYKIIAAHSGPLAVEGRRRPELTETVKPAGAGNPEDRARVQELFRQRGIGGPAADRLAERFSSDDVELRLRWVDHLVATSPTPIQNPPGFYVSLLRDEVSPPPWFTQAATVAAGTPDDVTRQLEHEIAYGDYRREQVQLYIRGEYGEERFTELVQSKRAAVDQRYARLPVSTREEIAVGQAMRDLEGAVELISFAEFIGQRTPGAGA